MLSSWDNSVVTQLTIEHSPSKMIIYDVVVMKTISKPEHQKTFRAAPERVCEVFFKK